MPTLHIQRRHRRLIGSIVVAIATALTAATPAHAGLADCATSWPGTSVLDDFSGSNINPGLGSNWRNAKSISTDGGIFKREAGMVRRDAAGPISNSWVGSGGTGAPQTYGGVGERAWVAVKIAGGWNTTNGGFHSVTAWNTSSGGIGSAPSGYELAATASKQIELRRWDGGTATKLWGGPQTPTGGLLGNTDGIGMAIGDGCIRVYLSRAAGAYVHEWSIIDNSYAGPFEMGIRGQFLDNGPFNNPPNVKTALDDFRAGDESTGTQPPLQTPTAANTLADSIGVNEKVGTSDLPYANLSGTPSVESALTTIGFRQVRSIIQGTQVPGDAYFTWLGTQGIKSFLPAPKPSDYGQLLDKNGDGNKDLDDYLLTVAERVGQVRALGAANEIESDCSGSVTPCLQALITQTEDLKQKRDAFTYPSSPTIQAAVRALPIMSGPLRNTENWSALQSLWQGLGHNPSDYVDIAAVHSYVGFDAPSSRLPWFAAVMSKLYPGKPIISTETGWTNAESTGGVGCTSNGQGTNLATAGAYTQRLPLEYAAGGITGVYVHNLVDWPSWDMAGSYPSGKCDHAQWGLFSASSATAFGTAKPAATKLAALLARLGAYGSPGTLAATRIGVSGIGVKHLLIQRNGGYALALWQSRDIYDGATDSSLTAPAQSATVTFPSSKSVTFRVLTPNTTSTATGTSVTASVPADDIVLVEFS